MKTKIVIKPKVKTVGAHHGNEIDIDKRLPKKYRSTVILHEKVEAKDMKKGDKYETAHRKANHAEKVKEGVKKFKEEEKSVMKIYHKNIKDVPKTSPKNGKCGRCGKVNCTVISHYR